MTAGAGEAGQGIRLRHATHVVPGMTEDQARKARMLDVPTLIVVLLVIPTLILHFSDPQGALRVVSGVLNWSIYGWFLFEFLCMLYLAPNDREYFRNNKLDVFVLVATFPALPGVLQAFWVLRLLRLIDMLPFILGKFVSITLLPYAVLLAFVAVFGGGIAFAGFEDVSVFDGIYWANTTVNTVGYGDLSASTTGGKLLSMVLQWTGNVILAMLIGGVAAFAQRMLLGEEQEELRRDVEEIEEDVEDIEQDVDTLLENLQGLSVRDRIILRELHSIKQRLDGVHPEIRQQEDGR